MDVVQGRPSLFMRRDEVETAWRWIEPILRRLGRARPRPQDLPGRHGRARRGHALIERDGRTWHEEIA